jgi:hypothetical protein
MQLLVGHFLPSLATQISDRARGRFGSVGTGGSAPVVLFARDANVEICEER